MKILDLFGKKDASSELSKTLPYRIMTEFSPYRLYANRKSSVLLMLKLKNLTTEPVLGSVVIELPKALSLDSTGLSAAKELRLGTIAPGEERESKVEIHGDAGTDKGEYTLSITAFIHYRDYGHVLNAVKKKTVLEVS
ncbi:Uncharacterised protein [uncultured archaeon]|nr:Uncharacterised protein [uncultured archaeon]